MGRSPIWLGFLDLVTPISLDKQLAAPTFACGCCTYPAYPPRSFPALVHHLCGVKPTSQPCCSEPSAPQGGTLKEPEFQQSSAQSVSSLLRRIPLNFSCALECRAWTPRSCRPQPNRLFGTPLSDLACKSSLPLEHRLLDSTRAQRSPRLRHWSASFDRMKAFLPALSQKAGHFDGPNGAGA